MDSPPSNLLLEALTPDCRAHVLARATHVQLELRTSLQEPDELPSHAYFMTSGIASVVIETADGGTAETAIIGREGMTSGLSLLGSLPPPTHCFIQVSGYGYRIAFDSLRELFRQSEEIRTRILECVQQQGLTTSQLAACNRLHDAESRLARWLLMLQDRTTTGDVMQLTQEFLAQMLGTRRTTVALVAATLQRGGLIEYSRGRVKILSRPALESVACDCYAVTRRLLQNLYA